MFRVKKVRFIKIYKRNEWFFWRKVTFELYQKQRVLPTKLIHLALDDFIKAFCLIFPEKIMELANIEIVGTTKYQKYSVTAIDAINFASQCYCLMSLD